MYYIVKNNPPFYFILIRLLIDIVTTKYYLCCEDPGLHNYIKQRERFFALKFDLNVFYL